MEDEKRFVKLWHVFTLLSIFWFVWLYTEVTEYIERDKWKNQVEDFIEEVNEHTIEVDGVTLRSKIDDFDEFINAHNVVTARYIEKIMYNAETSRDNKNRIIRLEDKVDELDAPRPD